MEKHSPQFLKKCDIYPDICIVLVSEFGLKILVQSQFVVVDGTFNIVECKLPLTTLMGFHNGIALPCAYMLSNSMTTGAYEKFYKARPSLILSFSFYSIHTLNC
jgi:hypothetical protein